MAGTQNQIGQLPQKSYGVFVPFLANKVISGTGFQTVVVTNSIYMETFNGTSQFEYYYYMYLKAGITYRFCFSAMTFSSAGIIQFAIKSDDAATTYNTLTSLDLYNNSTPNSFTKTQQTFTFSPSGYNNGDYVPCVLDVLCNSKNASSTNYIVGVFDPNGGFNFYEKYS